MKKLYVWKTNLCVHPHLSVISLVFVLAFLSITDLYAISIDQREASVIAYDFLYQRGVAFPKDFLFQNKAKGKGIIKPYYIFNASKGYVIVSGSTNTPKILGYSINGHINPDSIPENMQAWLDQCSESVKYLDEHNETAKRAFSTEIRTPIEPMLTCKWGQRYPYNKNCPINNNKRCLTGCLATALSQVMYFYKWPKKTSQEIPGYDLYINGVYTQIPSVPAGKEFDWENMLPSYSENESEISEDAVATLMSVVGTSLHMGYNTGTSEAYFYYYDIVPKTYFGYSTNQTLVSRQDIESWEELIYKELSMGHPVVYGGQSKSNGGHAFVVDGYDGDQLFHVDWGYDGIEGYYLLDIMYPYDDSGIYSDYSNYGYSGSQVAIINLVPSHMNSSLEYQYEEKEDIICTNAKVVGNMYSGQTQEIVADLFNKGAGLYGNVSLYYSLNGSSDTYYNNTGFTLKRRAERSISIPWIPDAEGNYDLKIKINDKVIAQIPISIKKGQTSNDTGLQVMSIKMDGMDVNSKKTEDGDNMATTVEVIGNSPYTNISIKNVGTQRWDGTFRFDICSFDESTNSYNLYKEIKSSGWGTPGYVWNYGIYIYDLPVGKYRMEIYANDIIIDNSWHFHIFEGIDAWLGPTKETKIKVDNGRIVIPSDILCVDLYQALNYEIIPNANPNTIYIINQRNPIPSTLADRNIIKKNYLSEYSAQLIVLDDNYSYFCPYDYTAQNISYKRTCKIPSLPQKNWETLFLPFDATQVSIDGKQINWDTKSQNESENFYLERIQDIRDDIATFSNESNNFLSSWTPYIFAVPYGTNNLLFSADNTIIHASPSTNHRTNEYRIYCNTIKSNEIDVFIEDDEGKEYFNYHEQGEIFPFRFYVLPISSKFRPERIEIKTEHKISTELSDIKNKQNYNSISIYSIDGQPYKPETFFCKHRKNGIYIVKSGSQTYKVKK